MRKGLTAGCGKWVGRPGLCKHDWAYKIVIPAKLKNILEIFMPDNLKDRVMYIENNCKDIWDWSEKVYKIIENNQDR